MVRKVVMDVDTGVDDALALFLAANSPELKVEAVTTVVGNVGLDKVVRNTLYVAKAAGLSGVPVYRGLASPISPWPARDASHAHGEEGLGKGVVPEAVGGPSEGFAPDVLRELAESEGEELTLITTAPLSNLAYAIRKDPGAFRKLKLHVMMGGAYSVTPYGHGNITPVAEFNVWHDPGAAKIVFEAGLPTVAVGLDVTTSPTARLQKEHLKRLDPRGEPGGLLQKLARACLDFGGELHDPMAVAYALSPGLFETEEFRIGVETEGALTRGQTVADRREAGSALPETVPSGRAEVCKAVDGPGVVDLIVGRLGRLRSG